MDPPPYAPTEVRGTLCSEVLTYVRNIHLEVLLKENRPGNYLFCNYRYFNNILIFWYGLYSLQSASSELSPQSSL